MEGPQVTVTIPVQFIVWMFIGLVAGSLASLVVRGRGMNSVTSIVVGLIGALIGGLIFSVIGTAPFPPILITPLYFTLLDVLAAFIGAVIVLLLFGSLRRGAR